MAAVTSLTAHEILLKNGKRISVKTYWEHGDEIVYQKFGTSVYLKKKQIERIVHDSQKKPVLKRSNSRTKTAAVKKNEPDNTDPFFSELHATAIQLYHQQKYETAVGFLSMCIDSGHRLTQSYLYRGTALFELARQMDVSDKSRLEMGLYAKSDLDRAISMGEATGLAYISRAKVKWFILADSESAVSEDLNKVIQEEYPLKGMAYYWKGRQALAGNNPFQANTFMRTSADLGYEEATRLLFDNPFWPKRKSAPVAD